MKLDLKEIYNDYLTEIESVNKLNYQKKNPNKTAETGIKKISFRFNILSRPPTIQALYKLIFPQVGEKFLPGDGQDVVGKGTYRVLADKDEIFKYPFFF